VLPFDRARLAASVRRAQVDAHDQDEGFAGEVAAIVALALERADFGALGRPFRDRSGAPRNAATAGNAGWLEPAADAGRSAATLGEPSAVDVESIGELVECALIELGRAPVARAFIVSRARRAAARDALRVDVPQRASGGRLPDVRGAAGTEPWNPTRIVAALMAEAGLPRERAAEVAERVESRVAGAGLRRLSTGLVRELVSNELFALGLDRALRAHEALGVPRYDLRRIFTTSRARRPGGDGPTATRADTYEERVAGEVLRRQALEDLLGEAVAERHRVGDVHLIELDRPHRVLWRSVPADVLLRREPGTSSLHEVALDAATIAAQTGRGLMLEELIKVVGPLLRAPRSDAALHDGLLALAAAAEGAGRAIDLVRPTGGVLGSRAGGFVARLVQTLDRLATEGLAAPRLWLTLAELEAVGPEQLAPESDLGRAVERLLVAGRLVPVWHGADAAWVGPGCVRREGDRAPLALGAAVALNLPRLARRAGPWREESLLGLVAEAARGAIEGLEALDAHQREARRAHGEPLRERSSYGIVPVGLDEALRILGDGAVRPAQGARVLGLLADAAARFAAERGLVVRLTSLAANDVAARFAELDAGTDRARQPRLFSDLPRPEDDLVACYSTGYDVPSLFDPEVLGARRSGAVEAVGAGLAELLATVPFGALEGAQGGAFGATLEGLGASAQGGGREGPAGRFQVWRTFEARRRAFSAGPEGGRTGTL